MENRKIKNPILPGFYPDPSICKADDWFYMVCSSFELYPGIPIFKSRDLAHWEQIGHFSDRENTVGLKVTGKEQDYTFWAAENGIWHCIAEHVDGRMINPEIVGCMTGMMAGMFASGNGRKGGSKAYFSDISYK